MFRYSLALVTRKFIINNRLQALEDKKLKYKKIVSKEDVYKEQILLFNKTWKHCIINIPFYTEWQRSHDLPDSISTVKELKEFPVLTKLDIYKNQTFILEGLKDYYLTTTGGTSGITVQFPTSKSNANEAYVNAYLGRSWWGIEPLSKILMFWGHSHLFGKGASRFVRQFLRFLSDFIINTKRISCYSLDVKNVQRFYNSILEFKPGAIISYSSNVFRVCKYMEKNNLKYNDRNLHGVILTSESVTQVDVDLIERHLQTSVINEYGMAETGPIAYSYKHTHNIKVFWDTFIVTTSDKGELMVTTIANSIFPLINYSSEDLVEVEEEYENSVLVLKKIVGKIRNVLKVESEKGSFREISTIFFDHVLKFYPSIYSINYRQNKRSIDILLTSDIDLDLKDVKVYVCKEVSKEFSNIDFTKVNVEQVYFSKKTIAGKNQVLVK